MKKQSLMHIAAAALAVFAPAVVGATTFFSDTFNAGSTLNSATPADPTPTSTAYQLIANKAWLPNPPTMTANDFKMGIGATTSGFFEAQTLFATNPVALTQPGDYVQLTVEFTNTTGLLTAAGQLGLGLYNSGQVKPIAGGINNSLPATFNGGSQNWQGYSAALNNTGAASRIMTRPAQSGSTIANQELMAFGITGAYAGGAVIGTATGNATLTAGSNYTEVLTITLIGVNSLAITNTLYAGPVSGGIILTNFGAIATNATFLTSGFDALAVGYTGRANTGGNPLFDISSIKVEGSVTTISTPPTITVQPVPVSVATGGSTVFNIAATGINVTYQWRRNQTNLLNGGNIAGATSSSLVINNASAADVFSGANGYYCVVTGAGNFSTNSVTNSLTLVAPKNLVWDGGAGNVWDLNNTASWVGGQTFNYGDSVTFNDIGSGAPNVTLTGNFLSASKVTVTGSTGYAFGGSGSIAGPGSLIYSGSSMLQMNIANTHSGGTTISNATAYLYLQQYQGLGTGPLTLAMAGGKIEVVPTGSATLGIVGDVNVKDDFTIQFDGTGSFAGVFLGNIAGDTGKTLTLSPLNTGTVSRYRVYGTNTVYNANLVLNGATSDQAQYNGTVLAAYGANGIQTFNGVISGDGGVIQRGGAILTLNGNNTFAGGTTPTTGTIAVGHDNALGIGPINVAPEQGSANGSGTIQATGGARTLANVIQFPSGTNNQTLVLAGTNNLTFTSPVNLNGVDGLGTASSRTFQVNNTAATTLSGAISDGGAGWGLTKTGTNTLYLNGANTYSGLTAVNAGVLAGSGTIASSVLVTTNASIGGGAAAGIGTLTVTGNLTLTNGNGFFRVNRSGLASDKVSVAGSLANTGIGTVTGTIVVTNLGAPLQVGDTFTLFNKAVTGGGSLTVTGGGAAWTNKLALNGSIEVIPSVNTNPTNIVASVNGNVLTLSWPADHTGWRLQVQTNTLATGLVANSNAWSTVAGSTSVNSTNITINPANGAVFYRLVYP